MGNAPANHARLVATRTNIGIEFTLSLHMRVFFNRLIIFDACRLGSLRLINTRLNFLLEVLIVTFVGSFTGAWMIWLDSEGRDIGKRIFSFHIIDPIVEEVGLACHSWFSEI